MNCLQSLHRLAVFPPPCVGGASGMKLNPTSANVNMLGVMLNASFSHKRSTAVKMAASSSKSSVEADDPVVEEVKSDAYSNTMTEAMGAVLTYRHELGMNYNFIRPDLIVGSCLQTPKDVEKLRQIGVKTVFCLQQNPDLDYFGVDIVAIQDYAKTFTDIQHIRAEIRDFDAFDLRIRLPAVISRLYKAINKNGGVTYIHCTAGLGRAPAVALAYMFWVQGYKLSDAHTLLQRNRSCFPKLEAIKSATADICIMTSVSLSPLDYPSNLPVRRVLLTGLRKKDVTLTWKGNESSSVEISGLDIGWGQKMPLKYDGKQGLWILKRELLEGRYEYKYIIDGDWVVNNNELVTTPNKDGHVNNYIQVIADERTDSSAALRKRLMGEDPDLTEDERVQIRLFLEAFPGEE